jgi:hypothetical protein
VPIGSMTWDRAHQYATKSIHHEVTNSLGTADGCASPLDEGPTTASLTAAIALSPTKTLDTSWKTRTTPKDAGYPTPEHIGPREKRRRTA